jgi:hypothetical protein
MGTERGAWAPVTGWSPRAVTGRTSEVLSRRFTMAGFSIAAAFRDQFTGVVIGRRRNAKIDCRCRINRRSRVSGLRKRARTKGRPRIARPCRSTGRAGYSGRPRPSGTSRRPRASGAARAKRRQGRQGRSGVRKHPRGTSRWRSQLRHRRNARVRVLPKWRGSGRCEVRDFTDDRSLLEEMTMWPAGSRWRADPIWR